MVPKNQADEDRLKRRRERSNQPTTATATSSEDLSDHDEVMVGPNEDEDGHNMDIQIEPQIEPIFLDYCTQTVKCPENWMFTWECVTVSDTEKNCQASIPPAMSGATGGTTVATQTRKGQDSEPSASAVACQAALPFLDFRDRQFLAFTGVSKTLFQFLIYRVGGRLEDSRSLTRELKIVMVLVKLKSNMTFVNLACMFDVSHYNVKKVFLHAMEALYEAVKNFVIWFNRETVRARMPTSFTALFPTTRAIIDASEVECSRPPDPITRVKMYSYYKSRFTVKYLVACAPSGEITFVSRGFGGRTTDTELTVRSGFIQLVQPGDTIMADKGFPSIEARLNEAGGLLVMPPFKKGQQHFQFSNSQNRDAYQIARVRIHVERVIERMKRFQMLDYIRADMRDHFDDILVIVSAICNCATDIIRQ